MKTALCAIAKNENLYIREWVEWYKNIGIDKIFLYDNNDVDGEKFEEVINDYIQSSYVEVIDVRGIEKGCVYDSEGINLQPKCYIECYENKCSDYDWICFFDIDEFLVFKNNLSLSSFLSQDVFNNTDTILISWEHYDDNNLYDYDKRPVMERFTRRSKIGFHAVKSIVRTGKTIYQKNLENLIHCFKLEGGRIKFSNGTNLIENSEHNFYKLENSVHDKCDVVLNHYKTKTITEYLYRHLNRHWGTGIKYTKREKTIENCAKDFFMYNEKTPVKEEILSSFKKDNAVIEYYKKINTIKEHTLIERYNKFVKNLKIKKVYNSKKFNRELGIITLTSWKNRIDNVYITLCNLLEVCPNFHIVLALSEDEFPEKEKNLPNTLKKLVTNEYVEILWTPNNYKTCKKLIFTIEKYRKKKVPIITADDDCIYITNYAKELYDEYKEKNLYVIRYNMYNVKSSWQYSQGPCTLYNPITFNYFLNNKEMFFESSMAYKDDQVITKICKQNRIKISYLHRGHIFPFIFANESNATNNNIRNIDFSNCYTNEAISNYRKILSKNVLLCAIVKNENHYIEEWVKHYQSIGVSKIVIYDNDDNESEYVENIPYIKSLVDSKYIDVYHIPDRTQYQVIAYTQCYKKYSNDYGWLMFFDADEYLMLEHSSSIQEELAKEKYFNFDMIHVNWKTYDDNDLIKCDGDYSVVSRFTRPIYERTNSVKLDKEIKSIIRGGLNDIEFTSSPHTITKNLLRCCDPLGNSVLSTKQENKNVIHSEIWLNHYICKTAEEYITIKLKRLGGFTKHEIGVRYNFEFFFMYNKRTPEKVSYFKETLLKYFSDIDAEKIMKSKHISHIVNKLTPESYNQVPTKENTTIKVINKPTVVKTLEPYKLPIKSIIRRY